MLARMAVGLFALAMPLTVVAEDASEVGGRPTRGYNLLVYANLVSGLFGSRPDLYFRDLLSVGFVEPYSRIGLTTCVNRGFRAGGQVLPITNTDYMDRVVGEPRELLLTDGGALTLHWLPFTFRPPIVKAPSFEMPGSKVVWREVSVFPKRSMCAVGFYYRLSNLTKFKIPIDFWGSDKYPASYSDFGIQFIAPYVMARCGFVEYSVRPFEHWGRVLREEYSGDFWYMSIGVHFGSLFLLGAQDGPAVGWAPVF